MVLDPIFDAIGLIFAIDASVYMYNLCEWMLTRISTVCNVLDRWFSNVGSSIFVVIQYKITRHFGSFPTQFYMYAVNISWIHRLKLYSVVGLYNFNIL